MAFKRVKWKGILLAKNIFVGSKNTGKKPIIIYSRKSTITPICLGKTFDIYNGVKFTKLVVSGNMIGHKFGEFSSTRSRAVFKKK